MADKDAREHGPQLEVPTPSWVTDEINRWHEQQRAVTVGDVFQSLDAIADACVRDTGLCSEPDCHNGYVHEDGEVSLCWACGVVDA